MQNGYPVRLEAEIDPTLSRWQWLVKWLLAAPHILVLLFLWVGFAALTMAAGVAILFTRRYPKAIFDFNVGVMRWTWRVSYYAFSAFGTDRYPPFSLTATDYPARLEVEYPGQLSRGLALVKWWLLAIPHYLIVALLTGGFATTTGDASNMIQGGIGLIGVVALVAGATLFFTGRYPRGMFDLVIGLNRWVYRVVAYAALMTDDYPPFRLDTGGTEPGTASGKSIPSPNPT